MNFVKKIKNFLVFLPLVLPLVYTPFTYFPANYGKAIFFILSIELLSICALVEWWGSTKKDAPTIRAYWANLTLLDKSILLFLGVLGLASVVGDNVNQSIWSTQGRSSGWFIWVHFVVWYFFLRQALNDFKKSSKAIVISAGIGLVVAATALFPWILPASWQPVEGARLAGIFGNAAFLANYLTFIIGFCIILGCVAGKKVTQAVWFVFAGVCAIVLILTNTRGAFLGLLAAGATTLIVAVFASYNVGLRRKIRWGVFTSIVAVFVLMAAAAFSTSFSQTFPRLSNLLNLKSYYSATAQTRVYAWGEALKGIKEHPILGWGMENFDVVHAKYYDPRLLRYSFTETVWDKPHNWLLEIGVAAGGVGVLAYLFVNGAALVLLYKPKKNNGMLSGSVAVRAVLAGLVVGSLVQNLFLFETTNTTIEWFFVLGIISALYGFESTFVETGKKIPQSLKTLVAGVGSLALIGIGYAYAYSPLLMSYHLSEAYKATDASTWATETKQTLTINAPIKTESAVFLAEHFIQLEKSGVTLNDPGTIAAAKLLANTLSSATIQYSDNPTPAAWSGQVYMALGEHVTSTYFASAETELARAVALSPRKQDFLFLLGRVYLLEHKYPEALAVQKRAVDADPTIAISYWFFGLSQIAAGQTATGLATIELAQEKGFAPTKDQVLYLIDNYASLHKYDKIIELYKGLLANDPENLDLYQNLAATYAAAGLKKEALETVQFIVKMYPPIKDAADKFIKENKLDK